MRKVGDKKRVTVKAELPLYAQVQEKLRGHIARMKVGDRLSSERQLSEYFKVDRITIRRAMMDLANEGYVIRHQGRGTFIRQLAAQDRRQVTGVKVTGAKVIGLIMPDLEVPMHAHLLKGVEAAAARQGVKVWIRNALLDANREYELLESLGRENLAGIITAPLFGNVFAKPYVERLNQLSAAGQKVVLVDQYVPGAAAAVVMVDKFKVGYIATEHLIMLGHRRICYVSTHTYDTSGDESYRGYRQALADYRVTFHPELEINLPVEFSAQPAGDRVCQFLRKRPDCYTAIATPQFSMGYGIYKALLKLGVTVGGEIALVANNMGYNQELAHITHTEQPYEEVGRRAVGLLFPDEGAAECVQRHCLVDPVLVVGDTCGSQPQEGALPQPARKATGP